MNTPLKLLLAMSALGLAAVLPAHAQLLAGSTRGKFTDPGLANTTVSNSATVSSFASGIPYAGADSPTSVQFTGDVFAGIGDGDRIDLGEIDITNGVTLLGSTATSATMDLYIDLPANGITDFKLTSLMFAIDNTANNGSGVPDLFLLGHTALSSLVINGRTVTFDLHLTNPAFTSGSGASVEEGSSALEGLYAYVHFSPVPEPSTYAAWGAALLIGFVAYRRCRSAKAAQLAA